MSMFSIRESPAPAVALEIAADRVSAATLGWHGGKPVVSAHAVEPIAHGVLAPSLTATNVRDRAALSTAVNRVLERMGRPRRIGLVVPDVVGKVSLVRFEKLPPKAQDLDQLVRWQVRKSAPFPIEEAQVSYVPGVDAPDGHELIVSLARRNVVEEYEKVCADGGAHAGLVDLATFNVVNAVLAGGDAPGAATSTGSKHDWLLVNVAADSASIVVLRGPHLIFFRNRAAETDGTLADLVHQTAMYYEDRLQGGGFSRVLLAGGAGASDTADVDQLRASIEERLRTRVDAIDPRTAAPLTDRITASPVVLDSLAPLVGMLLRDRASAAVAS
jgi:Tfp pilus assembly PilM family ATPase